MSWLRIDDLFCEHPKIQGLRDTEFRLHVAALCYCARHLTDGRLNILGLRIAGANAALSRPGTTAKGLVTAGLWHPVDDGYLIHDYLAYNPQKADVERERDAARARMRNLRQGNVRPNSSRERSPERADTPSPVVLKRPLVVQYVDTVEPVKEPEKVVSDGNGGRGRLPDAEWMKSWRPGDPVPEDDSGLVGGAPRRLALEAAARAGVVSARTELIRMDAEEKGEQA